ncbi:MAG: universal stress protein [Vicinamibacterales bacterium]
MLETTDFRLLLATDFSEACQRTAQAVVRLADQCRLHVTLVHVTRPGDATTQASRTLDSMLRGVRGLAGCRRVVVESPRPADAVASLCEHGTFDLVVAPPSRRRYGIETLLQGSFRARLHARSAVPLWTGGSTATRGGLVSPLRTVACLVDSDDRPEVLLSAAGTLAARLGARVSALMALAPIDDSLMAAAAHGGRPVTPAEAADAVWAMVGPAPPAPVDVVPLVTGDALQALLRRCGADVLIVCARRVRTGSLPFRFPRWLDRLPCPVVCVPAPTRRPAPWPRVEQHERNRVGDWTPAGATADTPLVVSQSRA